MKSKILYIFFVITIIISITSSSHGPTPMAGDCTGSPLSGGFCDGCHDRNGRFTPTTTITLKDANNNLVTNGLYKPNATYTLSINVFAPPSNDNPSIIPQYGAQAVVVSQQSPFLQAGTLTYPTTGTNGLNVGARFSYFNGRTYLEHSQRNPNGVFNATWTAPPAGVGTIGIYACGLAVNANTAFTGDDFDSTFVLLQEDLSISIDKIADPSLTFQLFPIPARQGQFWIDGLEGEVHLSIFTLTGQQVFQQQLLLNNQPYQINADLPKGVYTVQIRQNSAIGTQPILIN